MRTLSLLANYFCNMSDSDSTYVLPQAIHHWPVQSTLTDRRTTTFTTAAEVQNVFIAVGGTKFTITYDLVAGRSPLLEDALQECGGSVVLVDEDPKVFSNYLLFLEGGAARVEEEEQRRLRAEEVGRRERGIKAKTDMFARLAEIWILSDSFEDHHACNLIIDSLLDLHQNARSLVLSAEAINITFASSTPFAPLQKLIIDLLVLEAGPSEYEVLRAQGVTQEVWFAVSWEMKGFVEEVRSGPGRWEDALGRGIGAWPRCDWHFFGDEGVGCLSCGRG